MQSTKDMKVNYVHTIYPLYKTNLFPFKVQGVGWTEEKRMLFLHFNTMFVSQLISSAIFTHKNRVLHKCDDEICLNEEQPSLDR